MNAALRGTVLAGILAGFLTLLLAPAALALDVTFDANATSLTIVDDGPGDLNATDSGIIDFDLTGAPVGGVLSGAGRIQAFSNPVGFSLSIGGPPAGQAVLQNVSGASQTISVTINSSTNAAGPPLGWSVYYNALIDDPTLASVSSPSGLVELVINQSTTPVPLGGVPQAVVTAPTAIYDVLRSSDSILAATESRLSYTVELGPDDRVVLDDLEIANAISGHVYNQDDKCIDRMNLASWKLVDTAGKADARCTKDQFAGGGGDATLCLDDPGDSKTNKRETRLLNDFATYCSVVPAWGVNGLTCCEEGANDGIPCSDPLHCPDGSCLAGACISHPAENAANDLSHELMGPAVMVSATSGKCQTDVLKAAQKALGVRWQEFRGCKRANVQAIPDDVALVSTCLGPPQPDPRTKIAKSDAKMAKEVTRDCIDRGFSPVGAEFAGACTAVADVQFPGCVAERTQCAFCRAVNLADDIVPPLDCDLFDDAIANLSCP